MRPELTSQLILPGRQHGTAWKENCWAGLYITYAYTLKTVGHGMPLICLHQTAAQCWHIEIGPGIRRAFGVAIESREDARGKSSEIEFHGYAVE
ncbi:MAG: hypothetical protein CMM45_05405 [Rhodospirillaceae bacterium]|nr:hypothetical protein [Rhodospirillaceae bacterium]